MGDVELFLEVLGVEVLVGGEFFEDLVLLLHSGLLMKSKRLGIN